MSQRITGGNQTSGHHKTYRLCAQRTSDDIYRGASFCLFQCINLAGSPSPSSYHVCAAGVRTKAPSHFYPLPLQKKGEGKGEEMGLGLLLPANVKDCRDAHQLPLKTQHSPVQSSPRLHSPPTYCTLYVLALNV